MKYPYQTADPILYGLLKEFARNNRNNQTEAEGIMWHILRGKSLGYPFKRQHIIDCFIADFVCLERNLIIEVDGLYHQLPDQKISDAERMERLNKMGFRVIRMTNDEIIGNIDNVIEKIKNALI